MHPPDQADPVGRRQRPGPRPHGDRVREGGSVLRARRRRRRPDGRDGDVHVGLVGAMDAAERGAEPARNAAVVAAAAKHHRPGGRRRPDGGLTPKGLARSPISACPRRGPLPALVGSCASIRRLGLPQPHPFLPAPEECEQWTGAAQRVVRARLPLPAHPRAGQNTREGQSAVGSMCRETSQCRSSARSI